MTHCHWCVIALVWWGDEEEQDLKCCQSKDGLVSLRPAGTVGAQSVGPGLGSRAFLVQALVAEPVVEKANLQSTAEVPLSKVLNP